MRTPVIALLAHTLLAGPASAAGLDPTAQMVMQTFSAEVARTAQGAGHSGKGSVVGRPFLFSYGAVQGTTPFRIDLLTSLSEDEAYYTLVLLLGEICLHEGQRGTRPLDWPQFGSRTAQGWSVMAACGA